MSDERIRTAVCVVPSDLLYEEKFMSEWRHIRRTTTETFNFQPEQVRILFGDPPEGTSYEDFVLDLFYRHDGSLYGDGVFGSCADQDSGMELLPEGWDA